MVMGSSLGLTLVQVTAKAIRMFRMQKGGVAAESCFRRAGMVKKS